VKFKSIFSTMLSQPRVDVIVQYALLYLAICNTEHRVYNRVNISVKYPRNKTKLWQILPSSGRKELHLTALSLSLATLRASLVKTNERRGGRSLWEGVAWERTDGRRGGRSLAQQSSSVSTNGSQGGRSLWEGVD
jgi:hypothetical protein